MSDLSHFHTKVVGVTYKNDDGSNRQRIIKRCHAGEPLVLEHDADNPYDDNAISVCRANGQQLGHLRASLAEEIVARSKRGYDYGAFITGITGGTSRKQARGVNLVVLVAKPGVSRKEAKRYARTVLAEEGIETAGCLGAVLCGLALAYTVGRVVVSL